MFTKLEDGLLARYEPHNNQIFVLCDNELYTFDEASPTYTNLKTMLPEPSTWNESYLSTPYSVQLQLTKGCNFSCTFCYANSQRGNRTMDMPLEKVKSTIDSLFEWGVPNVSYVGGEIFFRSDLPEIIDYAHQLGLSQTMITNGIIPGSQPDKYKPTLEKFHKIQVSMNGVHEVYDESVQTKMFDRFVDYARNIASINQNVWISCVINENNVMQIKEVLETTREIGARGIRFAVVAKQGRGAGAEADYFRRILPLAEQELQKTIHEYPELEIETHFNPQLTVQKGDPLPPYLHFRGEGHLALYISMEGHIYPFPFLERPEFIAGNAFTDDLPTVWKTSEVLHTFRNPEIVNSQCKECPTPCSLSSLSMSYLWTGSLSGKVPCYRWNYTA